jgi:hypothetical protein
MWHVRCGNLRPNIDKKTFKKTQKAAARTRNTWARKQATGGQRSNHGLGYISHITRTHPRTRIPHTPAQATRATSAVGHRAEEADANGGVGKWLRFP